MWKYTGRERDRELLKRVMEQMSEEDYWILSQWHSSLMWYIGCDEEEINKTEEIIKQLQDDAL